MILCAVLFFVLFLCASPPSLNDTYHILTLDATDSSSCYTRTLLDILSSCGLNLFACTWTAIHLDIPDEEEGIVAIAFRRLLMVMAFLAPEIMVAWAALQFLCARQVAKDFDDVFMHNTPSPMAIIEPYGRASWQLSHLVATQIQAEVQMSIRWALMHGYFAWMGGFVLNVDDKPRATLAPEELLRFVRSGSVETFVITEAGLED
ncbi:hypothetical protein EDD22DRAFT_993119 [Suillus occidentalis]|nr:hypothetical protein EDD22DRAFT_993119 [Suillus occidentalis]